MTDILLVSVLAMLALGAAIISIIYGLQNKRYTLDPQAIVIQELGQEILKLRRELEAVRKELEKLSTYNQMLQEFLTGKEIELGDLRRVLRRKEDGVE